MTKVILIREYLIEVGLQVQKFGRLSTAGGWGWEDTAHRQTGPGEVAETSASILAGSRKRLRQWAWLKHLRPQAHLPVTHFLHQGHIS